MQDTIDFNFWQLSNYYNYRWISGEKLMYGCLEMPKFEEAVLESLIHNPYAKNVTLSNEIPISNTQIFKRIYKEFCLAKLDIEIIESVKRMLSIKRPDISFIVKEDRKLIIVPNLEYNLKVS